MSIRQALVKSLPKVIIAKETSDYCIVTDDPDNWHIVANRPMTSGDRVLSLGSSLHLHVGGAEGIDVLLEDTGDRKHAYTFTHAVPGDASCVPNRLEFPWCFMNHSCTPNTHDRWDSEDPADSTLAPSLRAARDIAPGEELTYDYVLEQFDYRSPFLCQCGAQSCRGTISGFSGLSIQEQERLLMQSTPYVRDRFRREAIGKDIEVDPLGRHLVADYWECDPALLNDCDGITQLLNRAASAAGAKVISIQAHRFENQGVTAIALLAESHISVHTWPRCGYASVDIYTCGACNPMFSHELMAEALAVGRVEILEMIRGRTHSPYSIKSLSVETPLRSGLGKDRDLDHPQHA